MVQTRIVVNLGQEAVTGKGHVGDLGLLSLGAGSMAVSTSYLFNKLYVFNLCTNV